MSQFSHIDDRGRVRMVDVSSKEPSLRIAVAQAVMQMNAETYAAILAGRVKKGNVLETARIAGILAAKKTAALIPMCHPLNLRHVHIDVFPQDERHVLRIEATVKIIEQTGVEMEALTAASVAALTIYDMCKSHDKSMSITDICLLKKSGGKSGTYKRPASL